MKPIHLDHLLEMANKFEHEKAHEFGVKWIWKGKKNRHASGLNVDEDINL
jgi:hypothetical protein